METLSNQLLKNGQCCFMVQYGASAYLDEIYRVMGIPQYMKEIEKKKLLDLSKILSKDN